MPGRTDSRGRLLLLLAAVLVVSTGMVARLAYWQIGQSRQLTAYTVSQTSYTETIPALRGTIWDRTGTIALARTVYPLSPGGQPARPVRDRGEEDDGGPGRLPAAGRPERRRDSEGHVLQVLLRGPGRRRRAGHGPGDAPAARTRRLTGDHFRAAGGARLPAGRRRAADVAGRPPAGLRERGGRGAVWPRAVLRQAPGRPAAGHPDRSDEPRAGRHGRVRRGHAGAGDPHYDRCRPAAPARAGDLRGLDRRSGASGLGRGHGP